MPKTEEKELRKIDINSKIKQYIITLLTNKLNIILL